MAGIVNQAVQQQPQQTKPAPETPEVTRGVIAAKKALAQKPIAQNILAMMQAAPDPATGIAQATIFLVKQLYEKSKGTMPTKSIVPIAQRVLVDVIKLGVAAGLFKYTPDLVKQAAMKAIELFKASVQPQQPAPQPAAQLMAQPGVMPAAPMMGA